MKREPRANLQKRNFNFEEFKNYSAMYEQARVKDENQSKEFYKLVKYVAAKTQDGKKAPSHDLIVRDFLAKYNLDLIEIPEEFKDVEIENYKRPQKRLTKTKTILTRSSKSLENYDVWRAFDRALQINTGKDVGVCKLMIPPALLVKAFGTPGETEIGFAGTGTYNFEDTNLDVYKIIDYKKTDYYHGFNREDEYYLTTKNLKKPEHRRAKKWPTI